MKFDKKDLLLYAVTDRKWLKERETLADAVEQALRGGVTFLQLREKHLDEETFLEEAQKIKEVCRGYNVPFLINDNVNVALAADADGVHVGQRDMEAGDVRAAIGPDKILGVSVQTVEQALLAQERGADYLGVGAVFKTGSKEDADNVSYEILQAICEAVDIPAVAIGGITRENIPQLAGSGIAGIAVISAIFAKRGIEEAAADLKGLAEYLVYGNHIGGAIFDVDGTLLDSSAVWEDAGTKYLESIGVTAEKGLGRKLFEMSLDEGAVYLKETCHLQQSTEEIIAGVLKAVEDFYYHEASLKEGAADFVHSLAEKGIPMVIATSGKKEYIEAALSRLGIRNCFQYIFTCSEVGFGKHNPEIFMEACRFLGSSPDETWVFEDGLYAVKTAKKAGFPVIGVYDEVSAADWEEICQTAARGIKCWKEATL